MSRTHSARQHLRFWVPKATVSFSLRRFLDGKIDMTCPVLDLSKGGMAFASQSRIKPGKELLIFLACPDLDPPIEVRGQVIYCLPHPGMEHRYHIGFAFAPFVGMGSNSRDAWEALMELERLYGTDIPASPSLV